MLPHDQGVHPALIGAAVRRGHVGSREATATLIHLVGLGIVSIEITEHTVKRFGMRAKRQSGTLRLVAGTAASTRHRGGGPVVRQGHVEGLSKIDRCLLSIIFDRIGHGDTVSILDIDRFSGRHPRSYWIAMTEWRELVSDTARDKGLLAGPGRRDVLHLRREVRRALRDASRNPGRAELARLSELSVIFGLSRVLARSLRLPAGRPVDVSPGAGITGIRWLCSGGATHVRSAFTPVYSSGLAPAQYAGLTIASGIGGMGGGGGGGAGGGFSGGGGGGAGGGGGGAD